MHVSVALLSDGIADEYSKWLHAGISANCIEPSGVGGASLLKIFDILSSTRWYRPPDLAITRVGVASSDSSTLDEHPHTHRRRV